MKNETYVYGTHYMCIDCNWEGHISECEIDSEYNEFKQIDVEYPYCPSCGGGVECS